MNVKRVKHLHAFAIFHTCPSQSSEPQEISASHCLETDKAEVPTLILLPSLNTAARAIVLILAMHLGLKMFEDRCILFHCTTDRWMDGRTDGRMDGCTDGLKKAHFIRTLTYIYIDVDGWIGGWKIQPTDRIDT